MHRSAVACRWGRMITAITLVALAALIDGCIRPQPSSAQRQPAAVQEPGSASSPAGNAASLDTVDGFVARWFTSGDSSPALPYRLFVPKGYRASVRYPLIVWLH